jgi:hypothetical protein
MEEEHWLKAYWRPAMAWQYMIVCFFDFIGGPIMTAWIAKSTNSPYVPWKSLTLDNSGFYHLAMGAVIGVAAWSRGKEKIQKMMLDGTTETTESETTEQKPT